MSTSIRLVYDDFEDRKYVEWFLTELRDALWISKHKPNNLKLIFEENFTEVEI